MIYGLSQVLVAKLRGILNDLGKIRIFTHLFFLCFLYALRTQGVSTVEEALGGSKPTPKSGGMKRPRAAIDEVDDVGPRKKTSDSGLFPPTTHHGGDAFAPSTSGLEAMNASLRREVQQLRSENDQLREQLCAATATQNQNPAGAYELLLKQTDRSLEQTQRLYDQLSAHKASLEQLV